MKGDQVHLESSLGVGHLFALDPTQQWMVYAQDSILGLWHWKHGKEEQVRQKHQKRILALLLDENGHHLVSIDADRMVLWNIQWPHSWIFGNIGDGLGMTFPMSNDLGMKHVYNMERAIGV